MSNFRSTRSQVLPVPGKRNILVTSALPYVNNHPHLGNIVGSVLSADVFARFHRARGNPVLYICGTDDYGTATETKAIEESCTPKQLCDRYRAFHADTYRWFNIEFDYFGQTSTGQQTVIAQDIFMKLWTQGYLEERSTIQPYCEQHNGFLADRFIEGTCPLCGYEDARGDQCDKCGRLVDALELIKPRCKLDNTTPVQRKTRHIFILLDKLQPKLEEWFKQTSVEGEWSPNSIAITSSWLKEGLRGRSITRDLSWGTKVPLPGYEDKCLYSWFDACIGYLSITASYTKEWEKWWRNPEVKLYQFMGKDNVPFHTVMFPGSLIGTHGGDWTTLHHISTTEYLNYEGGKFSKSRNVGVFGTNAKDTGIPSDVWRYYLLSQRPETGDTEFKWKAFIDANNNELLKNLGNFVNRVIKFINGPNYKSIVPDYGRYTQPSFENWQQQVNDELTQYILEVEAVKLRAALARVLYISSLGNRLLQVNTVDNRLAAEQPQRCAAVIGLAVNLTYLLALLLNPYLPETSASILIQLDLDGSGIPDKWEPCSVPIGHKINPAEYLFAQIKPEQEEKWREMFGGEQTRILQEETAAKAAAIKARKERRKDPDGPIHSTAGAPAHPIDVTVLRAVLPSPNAAELK